MEARLGVAPPISTAATEVKPIIIGPLYSWMKPKACAYTRIPTAARTVERMGTHQTHPVYIDACGLGKHGIRTCRTHGNSSLRTHKEPHQKAHEEENRRSPVGTKKSPMEKQGCHS